ncbi:MAG: hypothetical protein Q4C54_04940 [Clostridia bacterium]|nr:hypothetical protein [Clostridia bacterium]
MFDMFKDKNPVVLGVYFGAMLGAVLMMIGGAVNNDFLAQSGLIVGIVAGPSIGWIISLMRNRKNRKDDTPDKPL